MKLIYLDTNVILTRYAPEEPQHQAAKKILRNVEAGNLSAVTSVLTIVEVASVISRAYKRFAKTGKIMKREDITGAFLHRIMSIRNLHFISAGGDISIKIEESHVKLPALFAVAFEIALKLSLKTLDNLHLAAALISQRIYRQKIDYFTTLDKDILKRREKLKSLIGASVCAPTELVRTLKL